METLIQQLFESPRRPRATPYIGKQQMQDQSVTWEKLAPETAQQITDAAVKQDAESARAQAAEKALADAALLGPRIRVGTNARAGKATLSGGSVTIATNQIKANSLVLLGTIGGNALQLGHHYVANIVPNTSFQIRSTNGLDNSSVSWLIVEPA